MPDIREKRVDLVLQQLEELPTLPAVAVRVLEVTGSADSSAQDVVRLIESDPALSTRILELVHRADNGVRAEVTTVDRAVILLGFEAVRNAVLAISVFETFSPADTAGDRPFPRDEFWKHCVGVASCAELLAASMDRDDVDPSEAFVCGLLHDLGKVALDAVLPKSFAKVVKAADLLRGNIADVERTVIGLDHMVVGKRLAERWQLPAGIRECAWLHNQSPTALPSTVRNAALINLVTLSDLLVREQHLGYSGNFSTPIPREVLCQSLGISSSHLQKALAGLVERIESRATTLGLAATSSRELYESAIQRANQDLTHARERLASGKHSLVARAKFFESLSEFQKDLPADAPPADALRAIAQTASASLKLSSAVAFSLPAGRGYAEMCVVDGAGRVLEATLIEPAVAPRTTDEVTVLPAGDELEWLTSTVSPRLAGLRRFWVPLQCDGRCIGGVVWGAAGDQPIADERATGLPALASGWSLALRTAQIREEARSLTEQLAEANRQLLSAQNELVRSRMLTTVGEMAAGAAHEMNNPLAVISGRAQILAQQLTDERQQASAQLVYEQSQRLSDIITELMDFARPMPATPAPTDTDSLVRRAIAEVRTNCAVGQRSIQVGSAPAELALVDAQQISAALAAIIENAVHATDEHSGHIDVHTAYDPVSARLVITIADDGCGMDEATLKRAFDPFFSAKPAGRRRGMGLAKALRWIESSGGSIHLESQPDQGTRAVIVLPSSPAVPGVARQSLRKQA